MKKLRGKRIDWPFEEQNEFRLANSTPFVRASNLSNNPSEINTDELNVAKFLGLLLVVIVL